MWIVPMPLFYYTELVISCRVARFEQGKQTKQNSKQRSMTPNSSIYDSRLHECINSKRKIKIFVENEKKKKIKLSLEEKQLTTRISYH